MGQALYRYRAGLTVILGALLVAGAIAAASSADTGQGDRAPARAARAASAPAVPAGLGQVLALRDRFVGDVAGELGEDPARVGRAVRTVVDRWLTRYTRAGLLSERQATMLMDCWDGEACSPAALMRAP